MARPNKVAVVERVRDDLSENAATLLTEYRGLTVGELAELRAELRKNGATYRVVKNTLARRAAVEAGIDGLDEMLVGPTALAFCPDDPVGPAKALKKFASDHPELVIKGGYMDGQVLDAGETLKLADLESREELIAKLAGLMYGALANFARLLNAAPSKMAQLLAALEGEGGPEAKGFGSGEAAAPAEDAPADEAPAEDAPADEAPAEDAPAAEADTADEPKAEQEDSDSEEE